ncbi:hypothetical protein ACFLQZ_00360 [Acidobacteriota bacterium]
MKMKLFGKENSKKGLLVLELEKEINNWLKEHPSIKIVNIQQSSSGGSLHVTKLFISVWYEDVA